MSGGFHYLHGGPFQKDDDILVDEYLRRRKALHVGDTIHLIDHDWHLAGIFESGKLTRIAVQLPVLQQLSRKSESPEPDLPQARRPQPGQEVVNELHKKMPNYPIYTMEEFTSHALDQQRGTAAQLHWGGHRCSGHSRLHSRLYGHVHRGARANPRDRHSESDGSVAGTILGLLLKETLFLALSGIVAGIVLTYGSQWCMHHLVPSSLVQETVYGWWPIAGAIAIAGALLGAVVPATKAAGRMSRRLLLTNKYPDAARHRYPRPGNAFRSATGFGSEEGCFMTGLAVVEAAPLATATAQVKTTACRNRIAR